MFLLTLAIPVLAVLIWIHRDSLSKSAVEDKTASTGEEKKKPWKNFPYAWILLIGAAAVLVMDMYFDMPSVGLSGLIWKGLLAKPALTMAVTAFMWVIFTGPQRIMRYVKYGSALAVFVMFSIMPFTNFFGGAQDIFGGTVTKDMALSHMMYEKTWSKGSGLYSRLLPSQSSGQFNLMMDGGGEYFHFSVSPRDRDVLISMMEGLTVKDEPIRIEKLIIAVEEGNRPFAMYSSEQIGGGKDIMYRVTYYPHTEVLVSAERIRQDGKGK